MNSQAKILVVEDSPTQAIALRSVLEAEGFRVDTAGSAEAALDLLNQDLPDLVVADFHLPGMDGRELSRQIRLNARTRTLPLLMLTGAREQDLERLGLESGADAYVPKSAGSEVMLVRLRALLKTASSRPLSNSAPQFKRAQILLVHPEAEARTRLRSLLDHEGHSVVEAEDRADARRAALSADCVILPASAEGFDGLALVRSLDEDRESQVSPFQIVVLVEEPTNDLRVIFEAGADEVAGQSDEVLRARLRSLMRRKLLRDESLRLQAAEARAAAADDLARANADLQAANAQLRQAQGQLVQAAKMASLGELVAGIAHEINNPLAFILGHQNTVERLLTEIAPPGSEADSAQAAKARERLAAMQKGLRRIQDIVLNLRKFSRFDEGAKERLDVPDALETVIALLQPKLGAIEIRRRFDAGPGLEASPALLNQVVMNIIANAADALDGDGIIEVATSQSPTSYHISVSDSGPGIPPEARDRVFEPFYTTKPVGAGTGLGLAIAYSVVQAHDGTITIDDSPLGGARFTLTLPTRVAV